MSPVWTHDRKSFPAWAVPSSWCVRKMWRQGSGLPRVCHCARLRTGAKPPTALGVYLNTHPIAKAFLQSQIPPPSYATVSYFGVNAFKFQCTFVRYPVRPAAGDQSVPKGEVARAARSDDYPISAAAARMSEVGVR